MSTQIPLLERRPESLDVLRARAEECYRCPLHETRTRVVFGTGNQGYGGAIDPHETWDERVDRAVNREEPLLGPQRVPVMIVGEAPGASEDLQGEPFVGPSGDLLTRMIEAMGFERSEFYLCNTVCCRPVDAEGQNRPPTDAELSACRGFLEGQIRRLNPKVLLALGSTAARALTKTKAPVGQIRGRWWRWKSAEGEAIPVMVTYHPAALLRDSSLKPRAWQDLQEVMAFLKQVRR